MTLNIPFEGNKKLEKIKKLVDKDAEIATLWTCSNVTAIDRSSMSDHGPTHVAIVANAALRLLRNLKNAGVKPSLVKDYDMKNEDAEVVVFLAAALHDIGHVVHRDNHSRYSLILAPDILKRMLKDLYKDEKARTIITGEILHAIVAHHKEVKPLTIEAGVIRLADALDMVGGRSRISFESGKVDIHLVSAMAIDKVEISASKQHPIELKIKMKNSAGVFQNDNLLADKIKNSGLEEYVHVTAVIEGKTEKSIVHKFEF